MRGKLAAFLISLVALSVSGTGIALAHGAHRTDFTGLEVAATPGVASFLGCAPLSCALATVNWGATVNYSGTPGIIAPGTNSVSINPGGVWFWTQPGGITHSGTFTGGMVKWPPSLLTSIGACGPGVAVVRAHISDPINGLSGIINACLDDTHPLTVFPPTIQGTITLSR